MIREYLCAVGMAAAGILHAPAMAGDSVLYGAAEAWVTPSDFVAAQKKGETLVLLDQQTRLVGGMVSTFSDIAYNIESPEALTKAGTLQLGWLPDKGDLTVHRIEIWRGDQRIDLLEGGARYTVLRREKALERRSIDGSLTATLAVPGLKVGDILRFSQTITTRDQALGDAVQAVAPLLSLPAKAGFARVALSWPEKTAMKWQAGPGIAVPAPVTTGGFTTLTVPLPLAKREELPANAPARFTQPPLVQVSSFSDWRDVSSRMAPHFATEGTIAPGSALASKVAAISAASTDPLARAVAAVRLVQDDIAYLLNGMNGGNYLPQSPAETWENRFGDCKAKSLLLLAMLRAMKIESDAVLVRSNGGDAVSTWLPAASAFDHMIVRARIDGRDYWLDGTSTGTRLDTVEEVPPFAYALPLIAGGHDLVPVPQRWPTVKDRITTVTYDYRAGIDLPALYDAKVELRGPVGASLRERTELTDPGERIAFVEGVMKDLVGEGVVYQTTISYDAERGVGTITAKGLLGSGFEFERGRGKLAIGLPSTGIEFAPDRARAAWKNVPYAVGGPFGTAINLTVLLPENSYDMTLGGIGSFEGEAAGIRVSRKARLDGDTLHIEDEATMVPAEIAVADFARERAAVSRLKAGDPILRTGATPVRYWTLDPQTARRRIAMLEPAYAAIIALEPEQAWRWSTRAKLLQMGPDPKRALADFDKALALEPSAQGFVERSSLRNELGDREGALADARQAYGLEATATYARSLADLLAQSGETDEALALLESFDLSGDERIKLMLARADVMGEGGRRDEGWSLLEEAEGERPGDAEVLNAQCWYMGNWSHRLEAAEEVCDRAVKAGSYASGILDSRALVHYRLGERQAALADLQAALTATPDQTTSLYLRGLIAIEDGKREEGERDIASATRLYGGIATYFERFGIGRGK